MPIQFTCPSCGVQTNVSDQFVGQTGPCGSCGTTVTITASGGGAMPMAGPPRKSSSSSTSIIVIVIAVCVVGGGLLLCGGLLLFPAVQAAREAARRVQCINNMKQIELAIHAYHDTHMSLPPAYTTDEDGKPMHSWRVLILPFLGQNTLSEQYDFDQPWDSPGNLAFAENMPECFRCASDDMLGTETNYMVITGAGTMFEGTDAMGMRQITDGMSNTAMLVEVVGSGVLWYRCLSH